MRTSSLVEPSHSTAGGGVKAHPPSHRCRGRAWIIPDFQRFGTPAEVSCELAAVVNVGTILPTFQQYSPKHFKSRQERRSCGGIDRRTPRRHRIVLENLCVTDHDGKSSFGVLVIVRSCHPILIMSHFRFIRYGGILMREKRGSALGSLAMTRVGIFAR